MLFLEILKRGIIRSLATVFIMRSMSMSIAIPKKKCQIHYIYHPDHGHKESSITFSHSNKRTPQFGSINLFIASQPPVPLQSIQVYLTPGVKINNEVKFFVSFVYYLPTCLFIQLVAVLYLFFICFLVPASSLGAGKMKHWFRILEVPMIDGFMAGSIL